MVEEKKPRGWTYPLWIGLLLNQDKRFMAPTKKNRKLVLGYLMGFTEVIPEDELRTRATNVMFQALFGEGSEEFFLALGYAQASEPTFLKGAGFGYPDGERYFARCDEFMSVAGDETEEVFQSLEAMKIWLE